MSEKDQVILVGSKDLPGVHISWTNILRIPEGASVEVGMVIEDDTIVHIFDERQSTWINALFTVNDNNGIPSALRSIVNAVWTAAFNNFLSTD